MAEALGVIGARLNSSRLPRKHLLDLAGRPLIARLFDRLERAGLDRLILATTADAYNRPLVEWAQANGKEVFAYEGDVDDLMGRVEAVVHACGPAIIAYFCGDSPLIEPETVRRMVENLRANEKADVAVLEPAPNGRPYIHEGFMVWRRRWWNRLLAASIEPHHREHVGSAARLLEGARPAVVPEEPLFAEIEHRISVDTPADYRFMHELYRRWYAENPPQSIVPLRWVVHQLQASPALRTINAHVRQRGIHDRPPRILLAAEAGPQVGLGHVGRLIVAAHALQEHLSAGVELLIAGPEVEHSPLTLLSYHWIAPEALPTAMAESKADAVLLDLPWSRWGKPLGPVLEALGGRGIPRIGVDAPSDWSGRLDLRFLPSFYFPPDAGQEKVVYGWDTYLLPPAVVKEPRREGPVLVLTGGADPARLGHSLPRLLDEALPTGTTVDWVRGPYGEAPNIPAAARLRWQVRETPSDLEAIMDGAGVGLCVYGVGLFEMLQRGVPCVTFSPYANPTELAALAAEKVCTVSPNPTSAVAALAHLITNPALGLERAARAAKRLNGRGPRRLAEAVRSLLEPSP